mgnify:FL=1
MKVCIIGAGLTSLALAKTLVNQDIYVDLVCNYKTKNYDKTRTIGLSKYNVEFFNKNIININKFLWKIEKIEIFSENLKSEKIIEFEKNNQQLFSLIKNYQLYDFLKTNLKKNKFFKIKKNKSNSEKIKREYELIIVCDKNSQFLKKYFYKKFNKSYNSYAYTTIINHKKINKNDIATQIFTKKGPLAFLPISNSKTSVVYSYRGDEKIDLTSLIKKYNKRFKNIKVGKISSFKLNLLNLRTYHHENILAFGDVIHRIHPLAGQGFNMNVRDISELLKSIKEKIDNGLVIDSTVCKDFEKSMKHKNFFFLNGIDIIYEIFKLEGNMKNNVIGKTIKLFGKNKLLKNFFTKTADRGITL